MPQRRPEKNQSGKESSSDGSTWSQGMQIVVITPTCGQESLAPDCLEFVCQASATTLEA